jgi:hypothetical protein
MSEIRSCLFAGARFYNQLDTAYINQDAVELELAKEIESSR